MNDIKKRLAALTLAGFMVTSTSGCNNQNSVRYEINEQTGQEELVGNVSHNNIKNYYIVEIYNLKEEKNYFYLTERIKTRDGIDGNNDYCFSLLGPEINSILTYSTTGEYICDLGTVLNIMEFSQFVPVYSSVKEKYDIKEIEEIYNMVVKDYNKYEENKNVKSLTLK